MFVCVFFYSFFLILFMFFEIFPFETMLSGRKIIATEIYFVGDKMCKTFDIHTHTHITHRNIFQSHLQLLLLSEQSFEKLVDLVEEFKNVIYVSTSQIRTSVTRMRGIHIWCACAVGDSLRREKQKEKRRERERVRKRNGGYDKSK